MLSTKFSTNPESFIKFGRGRRIDLATSHGYTHIRMIDSFRNYFHDIISGGKSQHTGESA